MEDEGLSRIGCLRFDSVEHIEGGWASIEGGEAFRFNRMADLESDCLFLSNIGFTESHKTGLSNNAKIRTSSYIDVEVYNIRERKANERIVNKESDGLSSSPRDIPGNLCIDDSDWEKQVEVSSCVASRVFENATVDCKLETPPFFELKKGMREALIPHDAVISDSTLYDALETSQVNYSNVQRALNSVQNDMDYGVNLMLPKASHAFDILSKPLPAFHTKWIKSLERIDSKDVKAYLEGIKPHAIYLFRVNIRTFEPEYAHIINFGTGKERRAWITGVDALFLKDIATFDIHSSYEAMEVINHHPVYDMVKKSYSPEKHDFSYSTGIYLQNLWLSLTVKSTPRANILKRDLSHNQFAPFIKAYDRIALAKVVKKLDSMDINVLTYSKGQIKVALKSHQIKPEILEVFKEAGVIPLGLKVDMTSYEINSDDPYDVLRKIYMTGDCDAVMEIDKAFYRKLEENVE